MKILENHNLRPLTSMYVGGNARYFVEASSILELKKAISFAKEKNINHFILGGGSNIIISDSGFDGLVIKILIPSIELVCDDENSSTFEVGAGESWDGFVKFCIDRGLYGIENLSHIPGSVGASVVQNIGAYGQEVSSCIVSVKVVDIESLKEKVLSKSDLNFSYRKSCLNDINQHKGKYVVTSVTFCLHKFGELNLKYGDFTKYFTNHPQKEPTLKSIREAVISIRDSKFPFPKSPVDGTVGSFWNAEVIDEKKYEEIIKKLEQKGFLDKANDIKNKKASFTVAQGMKVPYGVLIEVLGFKGVVNGGVKILESHAGVINNFTGSGTAKEVIDLSNKVRESIKNEFGVKLNVEPELVGDFK
ncbi:MAG: UDP-N-acetylenolpyruvoylglucosamine reductase [Parcubacteria bacterium C7867-006]|nr:MAG: UDP-N-acetylenolpyruvoylglucosamine reductase [Parcubacteria bacterium C7867-006]